MSAALADLLTQMREHPAFSELLRQVEAPSLPTYREGDDPARQYAVFTFRSGARRQDEIWRQFLTSFQPSQQGNR